jgi:hypothetical protein
MSKIRNIVLLFVLVFTLGAHAELRVKTNIIAENFTEFSKRFYTDSLFQMSRIHFPLKGLYNIPVLPSTTNAVGDSIISGWEKKNWKLLKTSYFPTNKDTIVIENITYIRKLRKKGKSVTIKTYIEDSGFSVTEKYAQKKGKWYLIYFSSLSY